MIDSDIARVDQGRTSRASSGWPVLGFHALHWNAATPGPGGIYLALPCALPGSVLSTVMASSKGPGAGGRDSGLWDEGQDEDATVPAFRVLLLEDDAIDVRLIRACAAAIGSLRLICEVVSSVAAARERMRSQAFDLCITDFWLGFESSLRFVAAVSKPGLGVPVIVLTSLSTPEIRHLCLQAGATYVLGKENLSPDVLESAVSEAMRAGGAVAAIPDQGGPSPGRALDFLARFARVMQPAEAAAQQRETDPDRDPQSPQTPVRAFAALSETARLAVLEQSVAVRDDDACAPESAAADLGEAVAKGCSLVEAHGRPIAFEKPALAMRLGCHEAALIFLTYELTNRVSAVTVEHGTIDVALRQEDGTFALYVSGLAYGSVPALPATFGALFKSILRRCHGVVEMVEDPGSPITLVARFPDDSALSANSRPH